MESATRACRAHLLRRLPQLASQSAGFVSGSGNFSSGASLHQAAPLGRRLRRHSATTVAVICAPAQEVSPKQESNPAGASDAPSLKRPPKAASPAHTTTAKQLDIIRSMDAWVEDELLGRYAHRVDFNWQPSDLLPSSSAEDFVQQVTDLRARCAELPDDFWVCLAGNTVSEEGLPNSSIMLNTLDGTRDDSGADMTPWARWTRAWTGEESRHGKVLHQYLYLSGQVNMHALEKTSQYLVNCGMDPRTENNPYLGFVYATFVERATFLSHRVMAARAQELGDHRLAKICGVVAGDEKRHEIAYGSIVSKLMELDPDGTILSFADMMKKQMVMPAHMMKDGESPTLFMDYSEVAQRCGVYTSFDYADIVEHLVRYWKVREQKGLSPDAEAAQQYLCKLPDRVRRLAERTLGRAKKGASARVGKFSWVFNREVALL